MEQEYTTSILESMLDAVIVANPDGTIRTVNRAALELLGYAEEEIIGQPVGTIFEEEEEEEEEAFFRGSGLAQLVREGAARDVELTLVAKSGERIPVLFNGSVIRGEDGRLSAVMGVARDIRERKRVEERLIRLSTAVEASIDSIVLCDIEGRITDVNEASLKMYGADDKEDLIGKSSFDLIIAPEDREEAFAWMAEVLEKGHVKSRECHVFTKNGSKRPVEMSITLLKNVGGKPTGFVGITRDITERKRAEETLREHVRQIERLNDLFVGREQRMIELKREVNSLLKKLGQTPKYEAPAEVDKLRKELEEKPGQ